MNNINEANQIELYAEKEILRDIIKDDEYCCDLFSMIEEQIGMETDEEKESKRNQLLVNQIDNRLFAFPTNKLMFMLLSIFGRKGTNLPTAYIGDDWDNTYKKRKDKIDALITDTIKEILMDESVPPIDRMKDDGTIDENLPVMRKVNDKENCKVMVCNNDHVTAEATVKISFFKDGPVLSYNKDGKLEFTLEEYKFARSLREAYGPKGLRHLMAIMVGFEENYRRDEFVWDIHDHMKRLGYERKSKIKDYDPQTVDAAIEIVNIFAGFGITILSKKDNKQTIEQMRFLNMDATKITLEDMQTTAYKLIIRKTAFYKMVFGEEIKNGEQRLQYIKLLRTVEVQSNSPVGSKTIPQLGPN